MAIIKGNIFNDVNRDGIKDPSELGLPDWEVILYWMTFDWSQWTETSTRTDQNGDYIFDNLMPGYCFIYIPSEGVWLVQWLEITDENQIFENYNLGITPPCIPNWQCEPGQTGYELDGCYGRRENQTWQCEPGNTGHEINNCGGRRENLTCPCDSWQCEQQPHEKYSGIFRTGEEIGCGYIKREKNDCIIGFLNPDFSQDWNYWGINESCSGNNYEIVTIDGKNYGRGKGFGMTGPDLYFYQDFINIYNTINYDMYVFIGCCNLINFFIQDVDTGVIIFRLLAGEFDKTTRYTGEINVAGYIGRKLRIMCDPATGRTSGSCGSFNEISARFETTCIPSWQCEPGNTGYETDGCGNRRENQNWQCEPGNTGYEINSCGSRRENPSCLPPCIPNWQCEQPLNGYESDGCGNRKLNSACNPCIPSWQCEPGNTGYEIDGCGNRRTNSSCLPPANIISATLTVDTNDCVAPCTVNGTVSWANTGGIASDPTDLSITVNRVPTIVASDVIIGPGQTTIPYSFQLLGLIADTYEICASPDSGTTCQTIIVRTPSNIVATAITPSVTTCIAPCDMTVDITWTNNGETFGTFIPTITIDGIPHSLTFEYLDVGLSITKSFTLTGLVVGTYNICADPNTFPCVTVTVTSVTQAGFGGVGMILMAGLLVGMLLPTKCKDYKTKEKCQANDCEWKKNKCIPFSKEDQYLITKPK